MNFDLLKGLCAMIHTFGNCANLVIYRDKLGVEILHVVSSYNSDRKVNNYGFGKTVHMHRLVFSFFARTH